MIQLKKLNVKNFFSHSNSTINFEDLNGLVLLEGINASGLASSNGSGKSAILEGLIYALTGNTLRNVGVNDMVNRTVGKDTVSSLDLVNNGTEISISRYRKDTKYGDSIVLVEDGTDISSRLNKSTQETINTKLGIPYNVLVNTILLGEGLSSRFTQLSDPDKKSLIESTLSLSYDVNSLRDKVNSYLKQLKTEISRLEGSINSMKTMIDSFNPSDSPEIDKELLDKALANKAKLSEDLASLRENVDIYSIKIKALEDSKREYETLTLEYNKAVNTQSEVTNKLHSLNSHDAVCNLCGQKLVSLVSKNNVRKSYTDELSNLNGIINDITSRLKAMPEYNLITSKLTELQSSKASIDKDLRTLEGQLYSVTSEIASLESNIKHKETLLSNIDTYRTQVLQDSKSYEEKVVEISDYEYLYKLFSPTGLIVYILEDAVSYINDRLSIYTSMLIDKSYRFELSKGKLGLVDSTGASYQSLSNGEKRRLDISIQFSLHDYVYNYCGIKLDFCFIDEVLDTLDYVGVDNIFEVLRLKMEYCNLKGVIVITHNPNLKDKFDKVLTVVKGEDGFSTIN